MSTLPNKAVVLGTGGGALTIAAELGLQGVAVTLADFPQFAGNLHAVEKANGIWITFKEEGTAQRVVPVAGTSLDPVTAVVGAPLVIISVPCFGHAPFANTISPALENGQMVIWTGEGGGAFATIASLRALGRHPKVLLADTNTLPYAGSRIESPGVVITRRKTGGTLIAGLPTVVTPTVTQVASQIWPWAKPAQNAWETLLLNFNAIDHVATLLLNLGQAENRQDTMRLWGEGLSPGVGRVIGAVDSEYARLREKLGLDVEKRYEDFLVEQGLVDRKRSSTFDTMINSRLIASAFQCGPNVLEHRLISEDVPYALVLAASLGDEIGVDTPVIDSLCTLASIAARHDFWAEGRTLATWKLNGKGVAGLVKAVDDGWW